MLIRIVNVIRSVRGMNGIGIYERNSVQHRAAAKTGTAPVPDPARDPLRGVHQIAILVVLA